MLQYTGVLLDHQRKGNAPLEKTGEEYMSSEPPGEGTERANKKTKRCSPLLTFREMQIKMGLHFTPVIMAQRKRKDARRGKSQHYIMRGDTLL